jgi:hypothetical protein
MTQISLIHEDYSLSLEVIILFGYRFRINKVFLHNSGVLQRKKLTSREIHEFQVAITSSIFFLVRLEFGSGLPACKAGLLPLEPPLQSVPKWQCWSLNSESTP